MTCTHSLSEREVACADGMCPFCLAVERNEAVRLLRAIAAARSEIAAAEAAKCTCSSFVLQYEGRCCCGRGSAIVDGEEKLESALDAIAAYLPKAKC